MLEYQLSKQAFDNDIVYINYNSFELTKYEGDPDNFMWVTLSCDNIGSVGYGTVLKIISTFTYFNDLSKQTVDIGDYLTVPVTSVDLNAGTITFIGSKHKVLNINSIKAEITYTYIPYQENTIISSGTKYYYYSSLNYTYIEKTAETDILVPEKNTIYYYIDGTISPKITWLFEFEDTHYFYDNEDISLTIQFDEINSIELTDLYYIDFQTLGWVYYDETITPTVDNTEYAGVISELLFGTGNPTENMTGDISRIRVKREQFMWNTTYNQDTPTISYNSYKVKLNIPISLNVKTDLYKEDNINEYFVQHEEEKAINSPYDMEKFAYTPVVTRVDNGNLIFEDCTRINFNLHFRVHDGNDWTVVDTNSWNFDKYGYYNAQVNNKYYSYAQDSNTSFALEWKRSCQSDLLGYVGFDTNDVKFQKNKLKKSFIRLSFYDSNDPGKQNLLAYSTIFVDCNKLYSKFISRMNFNCYFNSDGNIVKGIKVDRELNTGMKPNSLSDIIGIKLSNPDDIEEYRLSSQISVKNKFITNGSSEGFYLYTWELNDNPTIPSDVYMKVEFNHAGYGRNIPMMAPYWDDGSGFKTNKQIVDDWNNNRKYGIKKYTKYSYIHLKAKYDVNTKRHIYYLDPETYGTKWGLDKNVLNINLYEARISFE